MSYKRGQNEGSIYPYRNGRWAAQVTIEGKRKTKYFNTKKEGKEWLKKMDDQINSGLSWQGSNLSIEEFLDQWLENAEGRLREKTIYDYRNYTKNHLLPTLGEIKIADLKPEHIHKLYAIKNKDGLSKATVLRIHTILNAALNQAVRLGVITKNPAKLVDRPKPRRKEMKVWNENQVMSFISALDGTRWAALFYIAVSTGLRRGELLGLKWADLDWNKRELYIQRQLIAVPGKGMLLQEPKTASSRRVVVLGGRAIELLRKHLKIRDEFRAFAGDRWIDNDLIFTSIIGTPAHPDNVYHVFKKLTKEIGLPGIRFHDLRHTAATLMLKQGTNPKIVQERLGHADIALTLNIYSHVVPAMQEEVASKMDEILTPVEFKDVFVDGELENNLDD